MSRTEIPVLRDTVVLRAAVPKGHFVTIGGALPAAGGPAYGPTYAAAAAGKEVAVTVLGLTPVVTGAPVRAGDDLEVMATGRVKPASDAGRVVAIAKDAATGAGETIRVLVLHGQADALRIDQAIADLRVGKLGFVWAFSSKTAPDDYSNPFAGDDFTILGSTYSVRSDFPTMELPDNRVSTAMDLRYFAFWFPLVANEPELQVQGGVGFGGTGQVGLLSPVESRYLRRVAGPVYVNGVPGRLYVGRQYATATTPRPLVRYLPTFVSVYDRFVTVTDSPAPPASFVAGDWESSTSPLLSAPRYAGSGAHVHVHIALPHDAPTPTRVQLQPEGSADVSAAFANQSALYEIDSESFDVYSSTALAAADYGQGTSLIVLPERDGIPYYTAPLDLSPRDVGFTWYMGFYPTLNWSAFNDTRGEKYTYTSWKQASQAFAEADFLDAVRGNRSNNSSGERVTPPSAADDWYFAFAVETGIDIQGVVLGPGGASDVAGLALADFTKQASTLAIDGVDHDVWVSNAAQDSADYSSARSYFRRYGYDAMDPVSEARLTQLLADSHAVSSTSNQIDVPVDSNGGIYQPDENYVWTRFMAVPVGSNAMDKLARFPGTVLYAHSELVALRSGRIAWNMGQQTRTSTSVITVWNKAPNAIDIGGTSYEVWVNRHELQTFDFTPTNSITPTERYRREQLHYERRYGAAESLGGKFLAFRVGDGYGE